MIKCNICGKICKRDYNIISHYKYKHNGILPTEYISNKEKILANISNSDEKIVCSICGKICMGNNGIALHYKHKHPNDICKDKIDFIEMKRTKELLDSDDYIKCNVCGRLFKSKKGIYTHYMNKHKGIKPSEFKSLEDKRDINILKNKNHVKCNVCGRLFNTKAALQIHLSKSHNISRKEYYDEYEKNENEGVCKNPNCNNETTFSNKKGGYYLDFCYNCSRTINEDIYKIKYGDNYKEKLKETIKKYSHTLSFFIDKYGESDGKNKYNAWMKNKVVTLDKMISKYGEVKGNEKFHNWKVKIEKPRNSTSKESLKVFIPVYKYIRRKHKINKDDIYFGISGSCEWNINNSNHEFYYYDFTIPKLNVIIEYNGEKFHANPLWEDDVLSEWKQLFTNKSSSEVIEYDNKKNIIANDFGYDLLTIWSSNSIENNIKISKEFIDEKIRNEDN